MSGTPRLLLVRLSSLGDVVLATSVLGSLRESLPGAHLSFLTRPRFRPLLEHHPALDALIEAPEPPGAATAWFRMGLALRPRRFDAVLDLQYNWRTLALTAGLWPVRARRADRARGAREAIVAHRGRAPVAHVIERMHAAARPWLRCPPHGPHVAGDPAVFRAAVERLKSLAPDAAEWLGVVPVAHWANKRWPARSWAELSRRWTATPGRHVMAFFGPGDGRLRAEHERAASGIPRVHAVSEELGLTAELLRRMELVVAGDTGLMHLATAAGTPVVAIFGPTSPALGFAPYGPGHRVVSLELPCQPCSLHGAPACPLGHHACLETLDVERVWREVLGASGPR